MKLLQILATLILINISACSFTLTAPEVNLVNLTVSETSLFETTLKAKIRLLNPNNHDINITGSSHSLILNSLKIGEARSNQELTIPALGEVTQDIQLRINNLKMLYKVQDLLNNPNTKYKINSRFFTNKIGIGTITSSSKGEL